MTAVIGPIHHKVHDTGIPDCIQGNRPAEAAELAASVGNNVQIGRKTDA